MRLLLVRQSAIGNTLENRLTGQINAGKRVGGSCQARAVGEHVSSEPQEARVSSRLGRMRSTAQMSAPQQAFPVQKRSRLLPGADVQTRL